MPRRRTNVRGSTTDHAHSPDSVAGIRPAPTAVEQVTVDRRGVKRRHRKGVHAAEAAAGLGLGQETQQTSLSKSILKQQRTYSDSRFATGCPVQQERNRMWSLFRISTSESMLASRLRFAELEGELEGTVGEARMAIGQAKQAFEKEIMPADALTTAAESLRSTVPCVCSMHGPVSM